MVRALVVGAAWFREPGPNGEWDASIGSPGFSPLPSVTPAVHGLAAVLSRTDGVELAGGAAFENPDLETLKQQWRALREHSEPLVVHFAGHGVPRGKSLYLPVADTEPGRLPATAIDVGRWLDEAEHTDDGPPTLFLLDVCGAGAAAIHQLWQDVPDCDRKAWVIAACEENSLAYGAKFTQAATAVLERLRKRELDLSPSLRHLPVDTFAEEIDRELDRRSTGLPQTVVRTARLSARAVVPPFFRNPVHSRDLSRRVRLGLDSALREFADGVVTGMDPIHFWTRASGVPPRESTLGGCYFSGRASELQRIGEWLRDVDGPRLFGVTGSPGAGKSALLGVVACLVHPDLAGVGSMVRSRVPAALRPSFEHGRFVAVHARRRSTTEVLESIASQLGLGPAPDGGWSVASVTTKLGEPAVILIDAVDESIDGVKLVDEIIIPLTRTTDGPRHRVLIGVRPWWESYPELRYALRQENLLDLDSSTSTEQLVIDLKVYLDDLLYATPKYAAADRRAIADGVAPRLARISHGRFLLAGLFVDHMVRTPAMSVPDALDRLPSDLPGMLELQLDSRPAWLRAVLVAVAHGKGEGMPLELIHHAALAVGTSDPTEEDVRDALAETSFYYRTTADADGKQLYRFFHQALVDHFADERHARAIAERLLSVMPKGGRSRDWHLVSPYLLRNAMDHAVDLNSPASIDALLLDPWFLVHADETSIARRLGAATSSTARKHAYVHRQAAMWFSSHDKEQRRQVLVFEAVRHGAWSLAQELCEGLDATERPPLVPRWSTGPTTVPNLLLTFGPDPVDHVTAVAVAHVHNIPVVLTGGKNGRIGVHEAARGELLRTFDVHGAPIKAIETANVRGVVVAVSLSDDNMVCMWDISDATVISAHEYEEDLSALCIQKYESEFTAFLSTSGGELLSRSVPTGDPVYDAVEIPAGADAVSVEHAPEGGLTARLLYAEDLREDEDLTAQAWGLIDDRLVEINGFRYGTVEVCAPHDGSILHRLHGYDAGLEIYEAPSDSRDTARKSRVYLLRAHSNDERRVSAVAAGSLGGFPVAISANGSGFVRVWDVSHRAHAGRRQTAEVVPVLMTIRERQALVSSDNDGRVRLWDAADGTWFDGFTAHDDSVDTAQYISVEGRLMAVELTAGRIMVHDVADGALVHELGGDETYLLAFACAELEGHPVCVSGGEDHAIRVWDLISGSQSCVLSGHEGAVLSIAITATDHRTLIVSSARDATVRVWDAVTGSALGCPVHLPTGTYSAVKLSATRDAVAACFDGEDSVFDFAENSALNKAQYTKIDPPKRSHVIVWFPGDLLCDDAAANGWDLQTDEDWWNGVPQTDTAFTLHTSIETSESRLAQWVGGMVGEDGYDVIELTRDTYEIAPIAGDWREYPLFYVTTHRRRSA
ncbi:hypothetical protein ACFWMR_22125 [Amycolatopsis thailandensis]|uniref:hypothetical protein n=1 Tax=Amycolatopsis thailandensis TaxID=589330 RepID=UPI003646A2A0